MVHGLGRCIGLLVVATLFGGASADIYLNNPRGSNNKLSEQSNTRDNNNRLFDSQNNADAGYQIGDDCKPVCQNANGGYDATKGGAMKGQMYYYQGSDLYVEWTAQHGCGLGNPNVICQLVLQYMCEAENPDIRDGYKRGNQNTAGGQRELPDPVEAREPALGQHETLESYIDCKKRQRNKGLYTADQNVQNNQGATATRQNPGGNANQGNRHGLECPEERDYYPYWHPSPWHDIAVLTDEPAERCGYYRNQSQNVRGKGFCSKPEHNNPKSCKTGGGEWKEKAAWGQPPPECLAGVASRDNHHGNTRGGQPHYYMWRIPYDAEGTCVLRLRYNVTTGDFHPGSVANGKGARGTSKDYFFIDSNQNSQPILRNKPKSDYLGLGEDYTLQLQVNTNQYGRTFQDRTHTFRIVKRPFQHAFMGNPRIVNYNVRGRRGNIVQVYPSVEYDFVPTELTVEKGTFLHFQWTGSDANAQGNTGNGRTGTDRSNLVQISSRQENVPISAEEHSIISGDLLKKFAYLDQSSIVNCNKDDNNDQSINNCKQLNGASAYFDGGLVQMNAMGVFHVMSTRNNDFSNRSQKATIMVIKARLRMWQKELGAVFAVGLLAFGLYLAAALYALRRPQSWLFAKKNRPRVLKYLVEPEVIEQKESERKAYIEEERRLLLGTSAASEERRSGAVGSSLDAVVTTGDLSVPWQNYGGKAKGFCRRLLGCCGLETGQELFLLAYSGLNLALFLAGFISHSSAGFLSHLAFPVAKGAGYMLDMNLAMVVLPTLKSLQTALHGKGGLAREWIPLDDPIKFHRAIGFMIGGSAIVHVLAHTVHMRVVSSAPKLQPDVLSVFDLSPEEALAGTPMKQQLLSFKMATGVFLALGFLALFVASASWVRSKGWGFKLFQRTHSLWPLLFLVLLLHGNQRTWIWMFFPAVLIAIDRLSRMQGQQHPGVLLMAKLLPKDVIHLTFEPPEGFTYQAGQYILLGWEGEWHPFTLTSAPEESVISVHIRCPRALDWCHALRRRLITEAPAKARGEEGVGSRTAEPEPGAVVTYRRLDLPGGITCCRPSGDAAREQPAQLARGASDLMETSLNDRIEAAGAVVLRISGPFGAPAQRVWEFGPTVVVGAGIGVTPFVSIMRSAQLRAQQRAAILGMAKVDDSIAASKERRKKILEQKREAALDTAVAASSDAERGGGGGSSKVGTAMSWFKRRVGKTSAGKGSSAAQGSSVVQDASPSSQSGPREGEDWNPEGMAELVQDMIPVPTKIHFYWIVRTQEELDWFYDLLASAVDGAASGIAEVHYFTTQEVDTEGIRALPCACKQYAGRPNWGPIFKALAKEHKGENIGVFLCGNPAIGEELASQSREHSDPPDAGPDRTRFSFFKEHF